MSEDTDGAERDHIYLVVEGYYQNARRYAEGKEAAIEYIHGESRRILNSEDIPGVPDYNILKVDHVGIDRSVDTDTDRD